MRKPNYLENLEKKKKRTEKRDEKREGKKREEKNSKLLPFNRCKYKLF